MASLPDPLVEACAKARLIETRATALAAYAKGILGTPKPSEVKPEEWLSFISSMETLVGELQEEVEDFGFKAKYGA